MIQMLITFEGIDGTGKTTLVRKLGASFPGSVVTREPLDKEFIKQHSYSPMGEIFAYMLDHAKHSHWLEAINDTHLIFCDRYSDSRAAYQSCRLFIPYQFIQNLHFNSVEPDHTYILNIDVNTAISRLLNRDGKYFFTDKRYDTDAEYNKALGLHMYELIQVKNKYLEIAAEYPDSYTVLDVTNMTETEVVEFVENDILTRYGDDLTMWGSSKASV